VAPSKNEITDALNIIFAVNSAMHYPRRHHGQYLFGLYHVFKENSRKREPESTLTPDLMRRSVATKRKGKKGQSLFSFLGAGS